MAEAARSLALTRDQVPASPEPGRIVKIIE